MKARLQKEYEDKIRPELQKKLGFDNSLQVARLEKIVINMGVGRAAVQDSKKVTAAADQLTRIAGQKAVVTHSKKAIAAFKLREDMPLGCKVTLRGKRMYEFLDRLVTIAMPRIRDFRGVSDKSFDGNGNYALGIKEHTIFPEISFDKVTDNLGMDIIICTTAANDAEARALLAALKMPFRKR